MDPYLEGTRIWPDFHDHLASEIGAELNQSLPAPFYARLEMRPEIGIGEEAMGVSCRMSASPRFGRRRCEKMM
jgi:hypothetical protein